MVLDRVDKLRGDIFNLENGDFIAMKLHFGLPPKHDIEPAELTAGGLYAIFALVLVVVWLTFIHP